jgi:hypothetical protein
MPKPSNSSLSSTSDSSNREASADRAANQTSSEDSSSPSSANEQKAEPAGEQKDRPDFDLFSLFNGPANVMSGVWGMAENGRKAFSGIMDTIASLQRAAAAMEQMATRMDRIMNDLEAPLRILTPELEKAAERVARLAELVEGPMDRLLPGLDRAVETIDRVALSQLPENIDQLRHQVGTVVDIFAELPRRFGGLTQLLPGFDRLAALAKPSPTSIPAKSATVRKDPDVEIEDVVVQVVRSGTKNARAGKPTSKGKKSTSAKKSIEKKSGKKKG